MLLSQDTYHIQQKLANYCRDGNEVALPGLTPDRIHTYQRLVFNVALDTLESAFPVTRKYLDSEIFEEMALRFFAEHKCNTPLLWRMPFEFYSYIKDHQFATKYHLPFLNDLLWFEWLEVELFMMEDKSYPIVQNEGDVFKDILVFNPEHRLVKLQYPVHLKDPLKAVNEKGDYFLLIYREKKTGKVQFINLSVLYAFLLEQLTRKQLTINTIQDDILYLFGINDLDLLKSKLRKFISDLRQRDFVLGFLKE